MPGKTGHGEYHRMCTVHSNEEVKRRRCHFSGHPAMFCTSPGQRREVSASLAQEENFSQGDPPVFGQRVVENSGVLKTVG